MNDLSHVEPSLWYLIEIKEREMHVVCGQCKVSFPSLKELLNHVVSHRIEVKSCEDGIEYIVRETIRRFFPNVCPHCEATLGWENHISDEDVEKFIEKLKE